MIDYVEDLTRKLSKHKKRLQRESPKASSQAEQQRNQYPGEEPLGPDEEVKQKPADDKNSTSPLYVKKGSSISQSSLHDPSSEQDSNANVPP